MRLQFCKKFFKPVPDDGFIKQITKRKENKSLSSAGKEIQKQHIIVWEECKYVPLSSRMNVLY